MKNQTKQSEEKVFTASDMGLILERIDDSFKLMTESMDIKFENVDQKFEAVDKRFDGIDRRLDGIDCRLDLVETKIDRLQDDMVEVKFELKRKVDAEEFERLEKRVVKLENLSLSHQA